MGTLRHREHYSLSHGCTLRNQDLNRGSVVSEYSFITMVFYPLNPPMLSRFYSAFQSVCLSLGPQLTCTRSTIQVGTSLLWLPAQAQSQKSTWDVMPGPGCVGSVSVLTSRSPSPGWFVSNPHSSSLSSAFRPAPMEVFESHSRKSINNWEEFKILPCT